jgi:hypothetical protein
MILSHSNVNETTPFEIPDTILDNKVLIYSVYCEPDHVLAEVKLVSIREMLQSPVFKGNPPSSISDLTRRYYHFENGGTDDEREFAEAIFDQETAMTRCQDENENILRLMSGLMSGRLGFNGEPPMVSFLLQGLPQSVEYAC